MKVASFNVNSLRARLPVVLDWLKECKPDVLCVQETKVQDDDFPADAFEKTDYEFVFKGQKSYNGVAIFSKIKIKDAEFGLDDEPRDEARLIKAKIGKVNIVNTYVPQGYLAESDKFQYKLQWFKRLRAYFQQNFKPTDLVVWTGDLNVAPLPIDVYDPEGLLGHVCFHPDVHKALENVMSWGFVDVFRMHNKEAGQYTFWDYQMRGSFSRNQGWRVDHIMATKPLAKKSINCWIDRKPRLADRPSDHTPIIAEFDL